MRQLGSRLGSAATAVYWHVQSKENLVVLAADAVRTEIALPDLAEVDWRTAATAMANNLYDDPAPPVAAARDEHHLLYGPGKARHDDHLLGVYQAAGFVGAAAERAMTVAFTYVLGTAVGAAAEAAWRARMRRSGADADAQIQDVVAKVTEVANQSPKLRALGESWAEADVDLNYGLNTILDGLVIAVLDGQPTATDADDLVGSALSEVIRALPQSVGRQAAALQAYASAAPDRHSARPDPATTSALIAAVADRPRVMVTYRGKSGEEWAAAVDPWAVVVRYGRWYLLCHSHRADVIRTYQPTQRLGTLPAAALVQGVRAGVEPFRDEGPVRERRAELVDDAIRLGRSSQVLNLTN